MDKLIGLVPQHFDHGKDEPCTRWCYLRLPERPGATIIHGHEEGEDCSWQYCYYKPTFSERITRLTRWLRSR